MTAEDPASNPQEPLDVGPDSEETEELLVDESTETNFEPPPVPRALSIPEVLLEIFLESTHSTCAVAARVCRSWSTLALDVLWRDMSSPIPLLQVLSPLQPKQSAPEQNEETYEDWDFANGLFDVDWTRFHSYATRIRTLVYKSNDHIIGSKNNCLSPRALERVALLYPHGRCLVPNILELECHVTWDEAVQTIPAFIGPKLRTLELSFCVGMPGRCLKGLFWSLVGRTPALTDLMLSTDCPVAEVEDALAKWLHSCQAVTEVDLPRYYQTDLLVGTLGKLPYLKSLASVWTPHVPYEPKGVQFKITEDTFPSLTNIDIDGHLESAVAILSDPVNALQLSRIRCICVTSHHSPTSEEVLNLCTVLAASCPELDVVWLNLVSEDDSVGEVEHLSFDVFRPLLECRGVSEFVVGYDRPVFLDEGHVEEIAQAWKDLKVLMLTRDPKWKNVIAVEGVEISILERIAAKLGHTLVSLGLFLDVECFTTFNGSFDPEHQFEKLCLLDTGLSPIPADSIAPLGLCLGSLVVPGQTWIHSTTEAWWRAGVGGENQSKDRAENVARWHEVKRIMIMVAHSKVETAKHDGLIRRRFEGRRAVKLRSSET